MQILILLRHLLYLLDMIVLGLPPVLPTVVNRIRGQEHSPDYGATYEHQGEEPGACYCYCYRHCLTSCFVMGPQFMGTPFWAFSAQQINVPGS